MSDVNQVEAKAIVEARDYNNMIGAMQYPAPGVYVITGPQVGNFHGAQGWHRHIGYVVQVRKKAGAFGSHMVLLRHPDGSLMRHENQSFYRMNEAWEARAKALFPAGMTPEYEDYTQPYTLGDAYPEFGPIIEAQAAGPASNDSPLVQITIQSADGHQQITAV